MLVSYQWLNEYLDLSKVSAKELGDIMSVTGIEVEGIQIPAAGLKKIVVGEVMECVPHPDSDHLSICQVNIGEDELSQIVCGAPNVKAGIKVIVALPGSRITGNVKIKKGKMRGVVSMGMICSLAEIGFNDSVVPKEYADGIYYLPQEAVNGDEVFKYLGMADDIIDLSITPNRADALSIRGVAYEVGAIYRQKPAFHDEVLVEGSTVTSDYIKAAVADTTDTPSYQIRMIENVTVAPSPQWLQNRLMNAGIRPINNVVDVTNYILLLFGQPLHAFDYDQLGSKELLVRRATAGEELVTLDGETRALTPENIVVTNGSKPLALAGVMGGLDSEIQAATTTVALEAAVFESVSIRRTAKQFNLRGEASSRFEKGLNLGTVNEALDAAAAMIATLTKGTVLSGTVAGSSVEAKNVEVAVTKDRINGYLGTTLDVAAITEIFETLGFGVKEVAENFTVSVPPRRWDISIDADLIEEVARIFGYDRLPSTLPSGETVAGSLTPDQKQTRKLRTALEGAGVTEAISYALTTEEKSKQFMMRSSFPTRLDWPMTEDRSTLRMNMISGLLDDLAYNVARKNNDVALYEVGKVFYKDDEVKTTLPLEQNHLAFALTGNATQKDWQTSLVPVDFYEAKGLVEMIFEQLGLTAKVSYEANADIAELHPGRTAKILLDDEEVGFVGQVHPQLAKAYAIKDTYVAELNLAALLAYQTDALIYAEISKFPAVNRDIAMLVPETATNQALVKEITAAAGRFLTNVKLFDVYQGANIEAGKKSMAYSLTFVNAEATLTDEEINKAMEKVTTALTEKQAAVIR
jgi:phenylalanyl-tRNA synthetase beta chain